MNVIIKPTFLKGTVSAVTSKSHAHRLMIAAALCTDPCKVNISNMNEDLNATKNCLSALHDDIAVLDCNESGSTLRFMLPIAMALRDKVSFLGSGRLPDRPLSPLKEQMEKHSCSFSKDKYCCSLPTNIDLNETHRLIYTVTGRLTGGSFNLAGNISSQYITGLLFALPLLSQDSVIHITSKLESIGYVNLTLEVLSRFGINIETKFAKDRESEVFCSFYIQGNQKYISPLEVTAEGDWSNAAFWLVAGALSSGLSCSGLNYNSSQGDKIIISFIDKVLSSTPFEELSFNVSDVPDLVPILAVLAASREGKTHITHAARLRIKESDRLSTVTEMIKNLGGQIKELPDGLIISGTGKLSGGIVNGYNDHRIVMAAAIASILCENSVTILGSEAVNKSYPKFFCDFSDLGGEYVVQ